MRQDPALQIDQRGFDHPGFAVRYHEHRPRPPAALLELLCGVARCERPDLVVDLGCGTGLSTLAWADRAGSVLGIDQSAEMLAQARAIGDMPANVRFRRGQAAATGLLDGSVDIVTCSQALHWMPLEETFAEVARILRPGGVFAAYDYDWPPSLDWELEQAYLAFMDRVNALLEARDVPGRRAGQRKRTHLGSMRGSGRFRFAREVLLHSREEGSAERFLGLTLSQGMVERAGEVAVDAGALDVATLRAAAERALPEPRSWLFSYRVRLGVR